MSLPDPIRVAMLARVVFPLHGFGGIERHVFHLVTHLARLGTHVTLYVQPATSHDQPLVSEELAAAMAAGGGALAVRHLRYDYTSPLLRPNSILGRQINYPWYTWQLGQQVAAAVRAGSYDVVHAQGLCAFGYGWLRRHDATLRRVPFIANPHGLEEYRTPDWRKWLAYAPFRALYSYGTRSADRAIATDACTRGDLPHYLGVDPARVVVIPSAIDVDECLAWTRDDLRAAMRARLGLDEADLVLLSVSRLERNKGYHILAEALARLRPQLPPRWRWLLVGQGKERAALEAQVRQLGIAEHVTFVGKLSDNELHSLYEEIDLFVHPTLYEGSSLVTLEAMIHRKPVVASAAGGIPDKVFDGRNGTLVRPGDVNDLAAKLAAALAARAQWPEWGAASVEIVRSTFDWPVVARATLAEYRRMLGKDD
ncbi:glycosyl transferase family 1 [Kouleothrix aurantiaca]|uniref:Glycosyl transferase family 1 n=1 Tax=Kouleothrix aurantiaca TaxID=186479 RepID=A0A0P9CWH7_9CHLR|nr:glycosyl transferase family 1 [Kouleothrix aurantiaca]